MGKNDWSRNGEMISVLFFFFLSAERPFLLSILPYVSSLIQSFYIIYFLHWNLWIQEELRWDHSWVQITHYMASPPLSACVCLLFLYGSVPVAGSDIPSRHAATYLPQKKYFPLGRKALLLTDHAVLESKGTSRHPLNGTGQLNKPGYQQSTFYVSTWTSARPLCHSMTNHLFIQKLYAVWLSTSVGQILDG